MDGKLSEDKVFACIGRLFMQNQELIALAQQQQEQLKQIKEKSNGPKSD